MKLLTFLLSIPVFIAATFATALFLCTLLLVMRFDEWRSRNKQP